VQERVFAVGVALFLASPAPPLCAQLTGESAENAASVVEITVIGSDAELASVRDATAASDLRGADARWQRAERFERGALLERGAADSAVSVRAFVVLSAGRAELYFADRSAERFLAREVTLANGLDALGSDAVSQVLTLSIVALAQNAEPGLTRSQTEKLLAPASTAAAAPEPQHAAAPVAPPVYEAPARAGYGSPAAAVFYAARVFSGDAPLTHGPGLRFDWIVERARFEVDLSASAEFELPLRYETATVGVELRNVLLRFGGTLSVLPKEASAWRFGFGGYVGWDWMKFTPVPGTAPAELELAAPDRTGALLLSPRFTAGFLLGSHVQLSADLFADIYPTRVNYTLSVNGAPTDVLVPWQVRPGLALALTLR
jgi:hypothetical protein